MDQSKNKGERVRKQTLRVWFELLIITVGMWFFVQGVYQFAPAPLQLIAVKVILVSGAFLHAHIAGKAMFKSVDWNSANWTPAHVARLVFYAVAPIAYAFGG